jgi:hypothetical protein
MPTRITAFVSSAALVLTARFASAADPGTSAPPPTAPSDPAPPGPAPAPAGTPPPAPVYNIYVISPPAAAAPSVEHLHEGFLLRMALGFGYFHDSAKFRAAGIGGDATISSAAFVAEISIGGSLSPGFVLGGAILDETAISPNIHYDGSPSSSARANAFVLGPFLDYYTRPTGGLHFGGTLGYATMTMRDKGNPGDSGQMKGFGVVPEVGYEWWVASEWGIGGLFRLLVVRATRSTRDGNETDTVFAPSLLFTATYN